MQTAADRRANTLRAARNQYCFALHRIPL